VDGFVDVGYCSDITMRPKVADNPLAWGDDVRHLQDFHRISFTVDVTAANIPLILYVLGDPLAVLWWQMGQLYNGFWYLRGRDD
jgi:hypothetical protein